MAAECLCKSYGVEIMQNPASLAKKQKNEFLYRMKMFGKPCGRIFLKAADFLQDESIHSIISTSDVVFVNNYAFDNVTNQGLLIKFLDLKSGARVVCLKSFVIGSSSGRNENAIDQNIFDVKEYRYGSDMVSWMPEGGTFFVHTRK